MLNKPFFTENELDDWVRAHATEAQGKVVELVYRLIAASVPRPTERRFPLADSVGQHGPDGKLATEIDFLPFVPAGASLWEVGTGINPGAKATSDYTDLTAAVPEAVRKEATFIFVTPLSGRRGWKGNWSPDQQEDWVGARRELGEWRDVKVIDGSVLIDWLRQFPSVARWFALQMGPATMPIDSPELRWMQLLAIGEPPPLIPDVFIANRGEACKRLDDLFNGAQPHLQLDTHYPGQVADFVSAYLASLDPDVMVERQARCLIVTSAESWMEATTLKEPHILVAEFDMTDTDSPRLLAAAKKAKHGAVYAGPIGGEPNPFRQSLPNPRSFQMEEALRKAGYSEQRARTLAQRSDRNLDSLLRCLQNLSAMPEWALRDDATDLAIAEMLGSWNEGSQADQEVGEALSGKQYGEWTASLREVAVARATPLTLRNNVWKMVARYEGWYALGPRISDKLLDKFEEQALKIFGEIDPKLELPPNQRFAANVYGKRLHHSESIRKGFADTVALLGSHPKSLTLSSKGKAEATVHLVVTKTLNSTDWMLWASINHYLPLLAEGAPKAFIDAIDKALDQNPCPFDEVFAQEGDGVIGENHMTGLLWGLESLAWDPNSLIRVTITLGRLAARDPGGKWANRPINSLIMIFLPWLPQTTASVEQRRTAISTLAKELPGVAWKLLLNTLPRVQQTSHGIHKPAWRDLGDLPWEKGVTQGQYWEQVSQYSDMAIELAIGDRGRTFELVQRIDDLPPPALEKMLAYLSSDAVLKLDEKAREPIWDELANVVTKHRKYRDADWAMLPEWVDKIAAVADAIKPNSLASQYARLFGNRDVELFEEPQNIEAQMLQLEGRREKAVSDVFAASGIEGILDLVATVEAPSRLGLSFGRVGTEKSDRDLLPSKLETDDKRLQAFLSGYIANSFQGRGNDWAAGVIDAKWTRSQVISFLVYLPFVPWAWDHAAPLLGEHEDQYWKRTGANPYETRDSLAPAILKLLKYERPVAALRLIYRESHSKRPIDSEITCDALIAAIRSKEEHRNMDGYELGQLIKALQKDPNAKREKLYTIEWGYSDLFVANRDIFPLATEERLASDPAAFSELIEYVYRAKGDESPKKEFTEAERRFGAAAWRVLREWHIPPGAKSDGAFDGDQLKAWVEVVLSRAKETDRLEACQSVIGKVLMHVPADPSGLWIHKYAADILNAKDADEMRAGLLNAFYNSRGAHWVDPTGAPERGLAKKYGDYASAVESAGYHRLAESLRNLAQSYFREAEDVVANANQED
jgi:hypothetical protein